MNTEKQNQTHKITLTLTVFDATRKKKEKQTTKQTNDDNDDNDSEIEHSR